MKVATKDSCFVMLCIGVVWIGPRKGRLSPEVGVKFRKFSALAIPPSFQQLLSFCLIKQSENRNTPILHSFHWLKITERIEYKLLSLTYKILTTTQPPYLHNLISVQPPRNTRSLSVVTRAYCTCTRINCLRDTASFSLQMKLVACPSVTSRWSRLLLLSRCVCHHHFAGLVRSSFC